MDYTFFRETSDFLRYMLALGVLSLAVGWGLPTQAQDLVVNDAPDAGVSQCDTGDPVDSPTVQGAINAASSGNTIFVCPGTYAENVVVDKPLTLQGNNVGTAGNAARSAESIIDAGTGATDASVTVAADNVTLDGFQFEGNAGVLVNGLSVNATDLTIQNNRFINDRVGASITNVSNAGTGSFSINNNLIDLTQQFADSGTDGNPDSDANAPTAGFNLRTLDLATPPSLTDNVFEDTNSDNLTAYYGIIFDGVNGTSGANSGGPATITGGSIFGTAQAIAILDGQGGDPSINATNDSHEPDESDFAISSMTMSGFTGDANSVGASGSLSDNDAIDFHAGVFVYTGGDPGASITTRGTIDGVTVTGLGLAGGNGTESSGLYFGGFSEEFGGNNFAQQVTATNVTIQNGLGRGIFSRGGLTDATITQSTVENMAQERSTGDLAISVKLEKGGGLTLTESFVQGPSSVIGTAGPIIDANNSTAGVGISPIRLTVANTRIERNIGTVDLVRASQGAAPAFTANFSGNVWVDGTGPGVRTTPTSILDLVNTTGSTDTDYTPWLLSDADDDGTTNGFQGDFSTLGIDNGSPQVGGDTRYQEAIDLGATALQAYQRNDGTYAELVVDANTTFPQTSPPPFQVTELTYAGEPSSLVDFASEDVFLNSGSFPSNSSTFTVVNGELAVDAGVSSIMNSPTFNVQNRFTGTDGPGNDAGWRILSAPRVGMTGADIGQTLSQASSGSILYTWDGALQDFVQLDLTSSADLNAGRGFFLYLFDIAGRDQIDADPSGTCQFGDACIQTEGPLSSADPVSDAFGTASVDVSIADEDNPTATEAGYVLGNPFAQSFDPGNLILQSSGSPLGAAGEFVASVQAWNPQDEQFEVINTNPSSRNLAPWQGFWVLRTSTSSLNTETLTFESSGRTTGAPFIPARSMTRTPQTGQVLLTMHVEDEQGTTLAQSQASLYAHEDATSELDAYDAPRIAPPNASYGQVSFVRGSDSRRQAQHSVPYALDEHVEIPLHVEGVNLSGTATISTENWTNIPGNWTLTLEDTETGTSVPLNAGETYTFDLKETADGSSGISGGVQGGAVSDPRFIVRAGPEAPLPVELTSFEGQAAGQAAVLSWTTASETNNAGFRIQQQGESGSYETVEFVEGAGTTDAPQSYQIRVDDLSYGAHTFRIEQVDIDGTVTPSEPLSLDIQMQTPLEISKVAPTPLSGRGQLEVAVRETQDVKVAIYDALGRQVRTLHNGPLQGDQSHVMQIDADGLASGMYFVRMQSDAGSATQRFAVVR